MMNGVLANPLVKDVLHLILAYVLALPIGYDREQEERSAGIRTFPIVGVASCALALIGSGMQSGTPDASSRIIQGLITGIGFIGGGAILKERGGVSGTATAASIWSIGIIGASVGLQMYHIAITLAIVTLITLRAFRQFKREMHEK